MFSKFQCPDKKIIRCEDCLDKCRLGTRCVPYTALKHMFEHQRNPNTNLISVTESLNPICYNWMRLTQNGIVEPINNMYSMLGTLSHLKHEGSDCKLKSETYLMDDINTGTCDVILEEDGKLMMRDIKNKRIANAPYILEYTEIKNPVKGKKPIKKYNIIQKGGKLKGDDDYVLQLNRYKIMYEEQFNVTIDELWLDYVFIDWSKSSTPKRYGITRQCYSVPVPILPKKTVMDIYQYKYDAIQEALKNNGPDKPCYEEDDFKEFGKEGSHCNEYCMYKENCRTYFKSKGIEHKYVFTEKQKSLKEIDKL
jgi:hypothetical protein